MKGMRVFSAKFASNNVGGDYVISVKAKSKAEAVVRIEKILNIEFGFIGQRVEPSLTRKTIIIPDEPEELAS